MPKEEFYEKLRSDLPVGTTKEDVLRYLENNEIGFKDNSILSKNTEEEFITCVIPQRSFIYHNYRIAAEFYFNKQTGGLTRIRVFE